MRSKSPKQPQKGCINHKPKTMQTLQIDVFNFNELDNNVQKTVIEKYRDRMYEWGIDLDYFNEECYNIANKSGFLDINLSYSLSNSQGDGLSFSAEIDKEYFIKKCFPNIKNSVFDILCNYVIYSCKSNGGRYCYASKNDIDIFLDPQYKSYPNIEKLVYELYQYVQNEYLNLCGQFEKTGYDIIEYEYSDENIIDLIINNECQFTKSGQIF